MAKVLQLFFTGKFKFVFIFFFGLSLIASWLAAGSSAPPASAQAPATTANETVAPYTDKFRLGTNMGWRNSSWSDAQYSDLVSNLGMNSIRVSLPEAYLDTWGYNVALGNMQHYQANNLNGLTAFLGKPTRAHSTAPANVADWQLDYYAPSNLYEPIWNADGTVNPKNYWASYVFKTVSTYKPYVKVWEIWNEPDFTNNWNVTQTDWWNSAPKPQDLPHWNGTVFSYIRLLRVSYEVIKQVDPQALVATGGLGYESFLDSVLRYTDNPVDGTPNSSYPRMGGAYFDTVSYHYYPQYATLNLANNQWNKKSDSDNAVDKLLTMQSNYNGRLLARGYNGVTYPAKHFIVTETGFSSKPGTDNIGSMDLLGDYLMKLQVMARTTNISQVHTFMLSDQEADNLLTDSYNHMGMYYDIAGLPSPAKAQRKPASYGVETMARTLDGATYDPVATANLKLPANVRGAVFQGADKQSITVLWARTDNNSEAASVNFSLTSTSPLTLRDWHWSQTKTTQLLTPVGGKVNLMLSAKPVILLNGTGTVSGPAPTATPVPTTAPAPTKAPAPTATPVPTKTSTPSKGLPNIPTPSTKLAPGQLPVVAVSASGSDPNTPVINVVDGNTSSYWGVSNVAEAWVTLDLGTKRQVNGLNYFVYGTGHAPNTDIQYSMDGLNWQTVKNGASLDTGAKWGLNSISVESVTARYIRFYLKQPSNRVWTLGYYSELQVLGQ